MSLATEFAPSVPVPTRARLQVVAGATVAPWFEPDITPAPGTLAPVHVLRAPSSPSVAAPVRLTRRGVVVLSLLVCAIGAALVWLAAASATPAPAAPAGQVGQAATVTVAPGDTLWSIASRAAPRTDPRAEVDTLQRLNDLQGADLAVGQVLRLR